MNLLSGVLDFLFPPRCPICSAYVSEKGAWCKECLRSASDTRRIPMDVEAFAVLDEVWALGKYHDGLRPLLVPLKFHGKRDRLPYLHTFLESTGSRNVNILMQVSTAVPVPLHEEREKARGFNQTELIFREWALSRGMSWQRALVRSRSTTPQFGLGADERIKNLSGAFCLSECADVRGKCLLLVDDICTTGTTLRECAKVLRKGGAEKIFGLVLSSDRS